jgi:Peptidase family M28
MIRTKVLVWVGTTLLGLCLFTGYLIFSLTQPTLPHSKVPSTARVDPSKLEAHVRMLSQNFHPRNSDHVQNLNLTAAYIAKHFNQAGGLVTEQTFEVDGQIYKNIRARFESHTTPLLVIGAHYDSHDITPGADDNASGVAGLIELAYLLGKNPPNRAVELVAYTLEEPPYFRTDHMGSAVHAESLRTSGLLVEMMISLEMIGYFKDEPNSQSYPIPLLSWLYPTTGNYISIIGRPSDKQPVKTLKQAMYGASSLAVQSINAPRFIHGLDFSDHLNYWDRGYPAVMVTDTSFNRNPHYHKLTDTYEKLDYKRMAQVVVGVFAFTQNFSTKN